MTISLNFNTMKASPSLCLGRIGEHNATDLEITWTNSDERIASYRVAFQTGGKSILSDSFSSMPIEVALWQQLTLNPRLSIQIIAYDVNGDYIGKSDKFCGLYFAPSVSGINTDIDGEAQDIGAEVTRLEAEVADNTAARHTHSNKTVLDKFGEEDGTPTYNGEPIGAGGNVDDVVNSYDVSLLDENKVAHIKTGEMYEIFDKIERGINYIKDTPLNIYNLWHDGVKLCYQGVEITCVIRGDSNTPYYMYFINGGMGDIPYLSRAELKADKSVGNISLIRYFAEREYTAAKDNKLSGIAANAQVNVLEKVKDSNGNELPITDKGVQLPAIPAAQIQSDWEQSDNTAKDYIKNKPSIPAAQVQADWNESDNTKEDYIKNKPDLSIYAQSSSLATVATSGSYNDLSNTPTIPTAGTITSGSTGYATGGDVYTELQNIPSMPSGTNNGDMLVWDGDEWVSKPAPSVPEFIDLPCAYQKVEYIEGTGTQYIKYYYKPKETDRIEYDVAFTGDVSTGNYGVMGGINSETGTKARFTVAYWLGKWQYAVGENAYETDINADNNRHKFIIDGTEGKFYVDNNAINMTMGQISGYIDFCALFGRGYQDHTVTDITPAKLYSVKIYRNSKLLANFVPCYKLENQTIGVYETVSNQFLTNNGTGTFIKGADVN